MAGFFFLGATVAGPGGGAEPVGGAAIPIGILRSSRRTLRARYWRQAVEDAHESFGRYELPGGRVEAVLADANRRWRRVRVVHPVVLPEEVHVPDGRLLEVLRGNRVHPGLRESKSSQVVLLACPELPGRVGLLDWALPTERALGHRRLWLALVCESGALGVGVLESLFLRKTRGRLHLVALSSYRRLWHLARGDRLLRFGAGNVITSRAGRY